MVSDQPFDSDAYMAAVAPLLGLTIAPERQPAVAGFLRLAAEMAALVAAVPLDDEAAAAAAPVFHPGLGDRAGEAL